MTAVAAPTRARRWYEGLAVVSGAALAASGALVMFGALAWYWAEGTLGVDFRDDSLAAANALLDGRSPYPHFGYPPLTAFLAVPFAVTPFPRPLFTAMLLVCVPLSLWLLGVRDWRCYPTAFLWAPVVAAVQSGNVTLLLLVAGAACWRWRDQPAPAALAGGLGLAAKLISWPLAFWFAFTGRLKAAVGMVAVAVVVTVTLWGLIGFEGLGTYPRRLHELDAQFGSKSYTLRALAQEGGLSSGVGVTLTVALAALVLMGVVLYGRAGDDARSYACAMAAVVLASPIVWLHSFALLLAPVAVLRPRLSPLWFLPVALWLVSPGTGDALAWQTAATLVLASFVLVGALLPRSKGAPAFGGPPTAQRQGLTG